MVVDVSPSQERFRIDGRSIRLLRYVHVLDVSVAGKSSEWTTWTPPKPPPFQPDCHGVPADWNIADSAPKSSPESGLFWGKKARKQLWGSETGGAMGAQADINAMLEFLRMRKGPDGRPVLSLLGPPLKQEDGWYSLQWKQFNRTRQKQDGLAKWVRAWHGCKLEALYSILYHGRLRASCDKSMGDRYFDGAPGIYVHKDATSRKAENYVRFVHLCGDGVFWAAKWEVVVDRRQSVPAPHQTDQWVQREDGVHLVALWVCGRAAEAMRPGDAVSREWRGELEANPRDFGPKVADSADS